jgi:hypothetical protein
MTVYERLTAFTTTTGFKFKPDFRKYIGVLVSKKWTDQGGSKDQLDSIQITEDTGNTWIVLDYPASFKDDIDNVIRAFVKRITIPKNIVEKPIQNPARPISYSSDPQKKERKRKPIQQPHFSGKKLINKK